MKSNLKIVSHYEDIVNAQRDKLTTYSLPIKHSVKILDHLGNETIELRLDARNIVKNITNRIFK